MPIMKILFILENNSAGCILTEHLVTFIKTKQFGHPSMLIICKNHMIGQLDFVGLFINGLNEFIFCHYVPNLHRIWKLVIHFAC